MEEKPQEVGPNGRKRTNTPRKNRTGANSKAGSRLKELWADPVWAEAQRAKQRAAAAKRKGLPGSRLNVPDGMRKEEALASWANAEERAKETMTALIKNGVVDGEDERATEALLFNLTTMRANHDIRARLAAASKVLEYTKSKPVAKSEVTLNKAEDWLAQVAASESNDKTDEDAPTDA